MEQVIDLKVLQKQLAQVDILTTRTRSNPDDYTSLLLLKLRTLKFKMYQEPGHSLPHIHIDYGRQCHVATYRIDPPTRIVGTLDEKYDRSITEWIASRKEVLLKTWALLQVGSDPIHLVQELAGDA